MRRTLRALACCLSLTAASLVACGASTPSSSTPTRRAPELTIVDDDYARALAEARATKRPIVAVTGAAWCDACREMRAIVLTDPLLVPTARDVVWLAIDVERDKNAAFVARFASEGQPVVWVIDPVDESAALAWRGTIAAPLLASLVRRASDAIQRRDPGGDAAAALIRAFRADASGEAKRAIDEYTLVVDRASGADRALAVVALTAIHLATGDLAACADVALRENAKLPSDLRANVVALGLTCDPANPPLLEAARALVADATVLASDRSSLFERIVAADRRSSDDAALTRDARAWLAFVDAQSRTARSPAARASLDGARLAAHIALREPVAAIPALAKSARDLPSDFVPPAHLARAFAAARRWEDALRAIERALALAYGPYRIVLLARKVDIELGNGDAHAALRTLDVALVLARSLPLTGAYARERAVLEVRRAEWRAR